MAEQTTGMETLVVGLDAACESVLESVFERGAAPTLSELFETGASGPLDSHLPPWTPSAWPTLFTGVNPGAHGVFDFLSFDGYDHDIVDRSHVREYALWELLDRHGRTSVVVNVPVTGPPRPIDGAVVPGYVAPADPTCHPAGVLADIRAELGDYRVYGPDLDDPGREERLETYRRLARSRGAAFRYLADRFDPAFGFLQFQVTDHVFHELPGDEAAAAAVYAAVDDAVGAVLETCDPDVTVVVSDHGIAEYGGYEFRVNEFLREHGYVETTREGGMPSWSAMAGERLREDGSDGPSPLERVVRAGARAGLTSQRLGRVLRRVGLASVVLDHVPADAVRAGAEAVDFAASTAYMRSRVELGVRINLAGREPAGVVPPDAYEEVRADLVELFAGIETPDGEALFDAVLPREAAFAGPHLDEGPDIVLVPAGYDHHLTASLRGEPFAPLESFWDHRFEGVLAVTGEGVDPTADLAGADLLDVAPTALATLGVPASDRMEGAVLPVVEPAGVESYPVLDPSVGGDPGAGEARGRERTEQHLADLGYLE
ncbi:alkaline phosphatase family protein [Haloglomus litoreum]|uniref:alkaline phosphatase family protein n=1 Tax=Haloglomus litoreum TaxID=3034026 RepID=UPI0023E8A67A|nr:alkaline phosphatase family protein [Haloglomus sp. DT116]